MSNQTRSHKIWLVEDTASAAQLASQSKQSGEALSISMPISIAVQPAGKKPLGCAARGELCQESHLWSRQRRIPSNEEIDCKMDCFPLPSIRMVQATPFRAMTRSFDPRCPDFGRNGIIIEVRNSFYRCCFLVYSSIVLTCFFHCLVLYSFSSTIVIVVDSSFALLQYNVYRSFC